MEWADAPRLREELLKYHDKMTWLQNSITELTNQNRGLRAELISMMNGLHELIDSARRKL